MEHRSLSMWTVYQNPADYPNFWVARRFEVTPGAAVPTDDVKLSVTYGRLLDWLGRQGLTCLPREDGDDPVIVETWV